MLSAAVNRSAEVFGTGAPPLRDGVQRTGQNAFHDLVTGAPDVARNREKGETQSDRVHSDAALAEQVPEVDDPFFAEDTTWSTALAERQPEEVDRTTDFPPVAAGDFQSDQTSADINERFAATPLVAGAGSTDQLISPRAASTDSAPVAAASELTLLRPHSAIKPLVEEGPESGFVPISGARLDSLALRSGVFWFRAALAGAPRAAVLPGDASGAGSPPHIASDGVAKFSELTQNPKAPDVEAFEQIMRAPLRMSSHAADTDTIPVRHSSGASDMMAKLLGTHHAAPVNPADVPQQSDIMTSAAPGNATSLLSVAHLLTPHQPSAVQGTLVPAMDVQQHILALVRSHAHGPVQIRLDPVELGQVRISLARTETGLVVHIVAERPETLDLMRRFSADLLRELADMGHGDATMSFSDQRERSTPSKMFPLNVGHTAVEVSLHFPLAKEIRAEGQGRIDIRV